MASIFSRANVLQAIFHRISFHDIDEEVYFQFFCLKVDAVQKHTHTHSRARGRGEENLWYRDTHTVIRLHTFPAHSMDSRIRALRSPQIVHKKVCSSFKLTM